MTQEKTEFTGRSYRNHSCENFIQELSIKTLDTFDNETDPNISWQILHDNINRSLDALYPSKIFSIKRCKESWVTNEHLELIRDKDQALKKAKNTKCADGWSIARRLRNECLTKIRKAKCDFVRNELNTNINDSKKFWRNVNDIWPNKKAYSPKITLIDQLSKTENRKIRLTTLTTFSQTLVCLLLKI